MEEIITHSEVWVGKVPVTKCVIITTSLLHATAVSFDR